MNIPSISLFFLNLQPEKNRDEQLNMKNRYHQDIIDVLKEANGQSMPVRLIARHIYNKKVGLFDNKLSFEDLYQSVRFYLWSQSNRPSSPFLRGERRGYYTVRKEIFDMLELDFTTPCSEDTEKETEASSDDGPTPQNHIFLFDAQDF